MPAEQLQQRLVGLHCAWPAQGQTTVGCAQTSEMCLSGEWSATPLNPLCRNPVFIDDVDEGETWGNPFNVSGKWCGSQGYFSLVQAKRIQAPRWLCLVCMRVCTGSSSIGRWSVLSTSARAAPHSASPAPSPTSCTEPSSCPKGVCYNPKTRRK